MTDKSKKAQIIELLTFMKNSDEVMLMDQIVEVTQASESWIYEVALEAGLNDRIMNYNPSANFSDVKEVEYDSAEYWDEYEALEQEIIVNIPSDAMAADEDVIQSKGKGEAFIEDGLVYVDLAACMLEAGLTRNQEMEETILLEHALEYGDPTAVTSGLTYDAFKEGLGRMKDIGMINDDFYLAVEGNTYNYVYNACTPVEVYEYEMFQSAEDDTVYLGIARNTGDDVRGAYTDWQVFEVADAEELWFYVEEPALQVPVSKEFTDSIEYYDLDYVQITFQLGHGEVLTSSVDMGELEPEDGERFWSEEVLGGKTPLTSPDWQHVKPTIER